MNNFAIQKM